MSPSTSTPDRPTPRPRVTHVSLIAEDVEASTAFYESVLGCERLPTPQLDQQGQADFDAGDDEPIDLQMLRFGPVQLHLWNDPAHEPEATQFAHFGVHVDDFEAVYREAEARDAFAAIGEETARPRVFAFDGTAQLYLRDPTGNLLEVDAPDVDRLDRSTFDEVVTRETTGPDAGVYTAELLDAIRTSRSSDGR